MEWIPEELLAALAKYVPNLKSHIIKILKLKGFTSASLLRDVENVSESAKWVIHYKIENRMNLDNYVDNHAKEMRQAALDRFCDGFSATRRILNIES